MLLGPDLTLAGSCCPEKALFKALAAEGENDFDLYHRYFDAYAIGHASANVMGIQCRSKSEKKARKIL